MKEHCPSLLDEKCIINSRRLRDSNPYHTARQAGILATKLNRRCQRYESNIRHSAFQAEALPLSYADFITNSEVYSVLKSKIKKFYFNNI